MAPDSPDRRKGLNGRESAGNSLLAKENGCNSRYVQLSCHMRMNICAFIFGAGNNPGKCANQHLSAEAFIPPLGKRFRSASVTPHANSVRDYWKGRAIKAASTDRRRQTCRTPSKPSWPLAFLASSPPALSRKSPWKSPWSWKSPRWRSSDLTDQQRFGSGHQPRPKPSRQRCLSSPKSQFLLSRCLPFRPALCAKTWSWSYRLAAFSADPLGVVSC